MVPRSVGRPLVAAVLCFVAAAPAAAQSKPLTVEEIYSYEGSRRFNGSHAASMTWVPDGNPWLSDTHHLWPASDGGSQPEGWLRTDATSGASQPLYTSAQLER